MNFIGRGFLIAAQLFLLASAYAQEARGDEWEWTITPYAWASTIKGHVIFGHENPSRDVGVDETLDTNELQGQLHLEAKKGSFGLFLQPNFFRFDNDQAIHGVDVDITVTAWMFEFGGFYRLGEWGNKRAGILDLIIGGRYWSASTEVSSNAPVPAVRLESTQGDHLADPLVGLRFGSGIADRLAFRVWGDIGGFGVNNTNFELKRSWHFLGFFDYVFTRMISLQVGYRALALDILDKNLHSNNEMKVSVQGPIVGLSFRF